jgi:2-hydroxymuconate-semialdehyde hydrolase
LLIASAQARFTIFIIVLCKVKFFLPISAIYKSECDGDMTSSYATIEGHKIFYSKGMEERGLPIVFVHGVPTSSLEWLPVQRLLSPYLKTYRIDLIGMGKSDKPLQEWDYNFANDAKILAGLMDQWGHEKMIVAGDDWEGGIALTFATLYPNRTDFNSCRSGSI